MTASRCHLWFGTFGIYTDGEIYIMVNYNQSRAQSCLNNIYPSWPLIRFRQLGRPLVLLVPTRGLFNAHRSSKVPMMDPQRQQPKLPGYRVSQKELMMGPTSQTMKAYRSRTHPTVKLQVGYLWSLMRSYFRSSSISIGPRIWREWFILVSAISPLLPESQVDLYQAVAEHLGFLRPPRICPPLQK